MAEITILKRLPMSKALRDFFAAQLGYPCGLITAPKIPTVPATDPETLVLAKPPYLILFPLWSTHDGPPMARPEADSDWTYQVTVYTKKGDQVEWALDKIREAWVDRGPDRKFLHQLTVPGMRVMERSLKDEQGADPAPPAGTDIITASVRFGVKVTPSE